jgi:pyrroline-5-carboxylate reductase
MGRKGDGMKTIGFIGSGNMGGAIIRSIAPLKRWDVLIYDIRTDISSLLAEETGATAVDLPQLLDQADIIVLAVKPQTLPSLFPTLSKLKNKWWMSMAAGVSLQTLSEGLQSEEVIRIMPNMAASVNKAVTALSAYKNASAAWIEEASDFVNSFGSLHLISEDQFSAFLGVSGSGIAAVFRFFHAMALGGVQQGLPYIDALKLIIDTAESASALIKATKRGPEEFVTRICSPKGTTIELIKVLEEHAFDAALMNAVEAASEKALQLERETHT